MKLAEIIDSMHGAVAEGVLTSRAAHELAKKLGVEVPIIDGIHKVIHGEQADVGGGGQAGWRRGGGKQGARLAWWLAGMQAGKQAGRLKGRQAGRQASWRGRRAGRLAGWGGRLVGRQAVRAFMTGACYDLADKVGVQVPSMGS
jgi:hypothetical protein